MAAAGRTRSMTMPMVSAKRTGLCGVLPDHKRSELCEHRHGAGRDLAPGSRNISPSSIRMSRNSSPSTTRRSIPPLCW